MIKVFIVEDHPIVVDGIIQLLHNYADIEVLGAALCGKDCKERLKEVAPQIILLDINLPDISGIELCKHIKQCYPFIRIIALTGFGEQVYVQKMIAEGVNGYILKKSTPDEIIEAIRTVANGENYFSEEVTQKIKKADSKLFLTNRETELLKLIVEGYTNREIADKLFLGVETINSYRKNLLIKLGAKNTATLVRLAISEKLI